MIFVLLLLISGSICSAVGQEIQMRVGRENFFKISSPFRETRGVFILRYVKIRLIKYQKSNIWLWLFVKSVWALLSLI